MAASWYHGCLYERRYVQVIIKNVQNGKFCRLSSTTNQIKPKFLVENYAVPLIGTVSRCASTKRSVLLEKRAV